MVMKSTDWVFLNDNLKLLEQGVVVYACNPSPREDPKFEASLAYIVEA